MNVWERIIIAAGALFTIMVIGILFFVEDIPVPVKSEEELAREQFEAEKAAELEKLIGISEALMPQLAADIGTEPNGPLNLRVIDKDQAVNVNDAFVDKTFSPEEIDIIKNSLTTIGLLKEDYDLATGMANLNLSQRSVFFDPSTGVTYAVINAPDFLITKEAKDKFLVEAIAHNFQDRVLNIHNNILDCKSNLDNIFAFEAMITGQAELVSAAQAKGLKPAEYEGDLSQEFRDHYKAEANNPIYQVFNGMPSYLRKRQMEIKASGSALIQAYLKADPENTIAKMWERMPVSSEQILHYEKYAEDDVPKIIDISSMADVMPEGFALYYTGTLGEFDVRYLARANETTLDNADNIADGWDGIHYAIYKNEDKTIVVCASIWDSSADALAFSNAMKVILKDHFGIGNFGTKKRRDRFSFIAGDIKDLNRNELLLKLETSPFDEGRPQAENPETPEGNEQ